jgi:selenocysteine lyase/cysteine desulfurase
VPDQRGPHVLGVAVSDQVRPRLLAALEQRNVHLAARGSALRISPHLYTTTDDLDRLFAALDAALTST